MPRRIEVELTSRRDDGTWTWRAAGARQPKGELDGSLLHEGAAVGDVLRADAEFELEGILVTAVLPPKERERKEPERLELLGSTDTAPDVTTQLVRERGSGRGQRREGDRGSDRRKRRERPSRSQPRESAPSRGTDRPPARPKPKRLRPGRAHRQELVRGLPEEQRPVAELLLRGGVPEVRETLERQRAAAEAEGLPAVRPEPIVDVAEKLLPHLRGAEWQDRAEAALEQAQEVDLRDLRSVVVAAEDGARDDEARKVAEELRATLAQRVEDEHRAWLSELTGLLDEDRVVRALRLSSRPPKAGAPLPPELAGRLADAAAANLTAETTADRYAIVLDALAYSPIRTQVVPQHVPESPADSLVAAVRKLAGRLPQIASAFGVEPPPPGKKRAGKPRPPANAESKP